MNGKMSGGPHIASLASVSGCSSYSHLCVCVFSFSSHSDTDKTFLEMHNEIPEIINMTEGKEVLIPCRVSSPSINVTLKKVKLLSHALHCK